MRDLLFLLRVATYKRAYWSFMHDNLSSTSTSLSKVSLTTYREIRSQGWIFSSSRGTLLCYWDEHLKSDFSTLGSLFLCSSQIPKGLFRNRNLECMELLQWQRQFIKLRFFAYLGSCPVLVSRRDYNIYLYFLYWWNNCPLFLRKRAEVNGVLPSAVFGWDWKNSNPRHSGPSAATLSAWPLLYITFHSTNDFWSGPYWRLWM